MKMILLLLLVAYIGENNKAVTSFHIQYKGDLSCDGERIVYLDMDNYTKEDVAKCKARDSIVMAYVSSQFESWRDDASQFRWADTGKKLDDWQGEKWVNPYSENVKKIMIARIKRAKALGFNGVDFDNTDFYHFETGFDSSKEAAVDYTQFLIDESHKQGMFYSLKNSMDIIPELKRVDYYQGESCHKYKECHMYDVTNRPVFIIEYRRCPRSKKLYENAYTVKKKVSMTPKYKVCK